MKFIGFHLRQNNKSGIILIVVLWAIVILSILAIGLGRAARIDLALAKHHAGKLKADGALWAGIQYAQNQIRLSQGTKEPPADTFYQCGFKVPDGKTPQELFGGIRLNDSSFDIGYVLKSPEAQGGVCYGFQDEERRININGLHRPNAQIAVHFFMRAGLPQDQAQALVDEIVAWHEGDTSTGRKLSSAVQETKAAAFENLEELLLLEGMTPELYKRVKDDLTVFPLSGELRVNVNTASETVLRSLFDVASEASPGAGDAESLLRKVLAFRSGEDGRPCTVDDQAIVLAESGKLGLGPGELALYLTEANYLKAESRYFRFWIRGRND